MARQIDEQTRALLRRILADRASNVVEFTRTARVGGHRSDEGVENLLSERLSRYEKEQRVKAAMVESLDAGRSIAIEESRGDAAMGMDAATYFHFRVKVDGVRLLRQVSDRRCRFGRSDRRGDQRQAG